MAGLKGWFGNLSLARKLTGIGVIATTVSIGCAFVVLIPIDMVDTRVRMTRSLATTADATALNSTAAISFGDAKAAAETLSALRADLHVVTAAILLPDGRLFARFDRDPRHPAEIVLDRAHPQPPPVNGLAGQAWKHERRRLARLRRRRNTTFGLGRPGFRP